MELSEKEQKLLDFIKNEEAVVTVKLIEEQLGKEYLGAVGRLINLELIEKKKKRIENVSNPYGRRFIKCFVIKKKEE